MSLVLPPLDGRLDLKGLLGEGGMGQVHRAWDRTLERAVAVKFVRGSDPGEAERLLLEARLQARVEHPNVVRVHEVGSLDGRPCIVMQLVEGSTLADLPRKCPLDLKIELLRQAALGLHAAHLQGLIHRDMKPGNVLVEAAEGGAVRALVSDFGLARDEDGGLTRSGLPAGTLDFMAPEILMGAGPVDFRVDVYSLGATAYTLLSGRFPFRATSGPRTAQASDLPAETGGGAHLLRIILEEDPPPLVGVPADLCTVVARAMEKLPADRYASAEAFAEDLARFLKGEPIEARRSTTLDRLFKWGRRNPIAARASMAAIMAVVAGLGWAVWMSRRASLESLEAARLGAEAQDLDQSLTVEQLLPLHDLRPVQARMRAALGSVDQRRAGRADGPAAFFKGRAHQLLGEQEAALAWLKKAWEVGDRRPEVAFALASSESDRYAQERARIAGIENLAAKSRLLAKAQQEWRDPALARLAGIPVGKDTLGRLARARIAYMEDRFEEAVAVARAVADEDPSRLEARELSLRATYPLVRQLNEQGQRPQAMALVLAGIEEGTSALAMARSSLELRILLVRLHLLWDLFEAPLAEQARHFDAAERLIAEAQVLAEDSPPVLVAAAEVNRTQAKRLYSQGLDFVPTLLAGLAFLERATQADPSNASAWRALGVHEQHAVDVLRNAGQDNTRHIAVGIDAARRAQALLPNDAYSKLVEAELLITRAMRAQAAGQAGEEDVARAVGLCDQVLAEGLETSRAMLTKARAFWKRGLGCLLSGKDPRADLALAWSTFSELRALHPEQATPPGHALDFVFDWGSLALAEDRPEGVPFGEGIAMGRALVAVRPGHAIHRGQLGRLLCLAAVVARREHKPHEALLREGEALVRELAGTGIAQLMRRTLAHSAVELAWVTRSAADGAIAAGRAKECLKAVPADPEAQALLASALLVQAEGARGTPRERLLQASADAAGKAIQGGQRGAIPFALRGRAQEALALGSGQADLAEARRMNPRLHLLRVD